MLQKDEMKMEGGNYAGRPACVFPLGSGELEE